MDSIFFLGQDSETLPSFLERLGYSIVRPDCIQPLEDAVSRARTDLILIDGRSFQDLNTLYQLLKSQRSSRPAPIVCIAERSLVERIGEDLSSEIELIETPFSVGALASRIALTLRLRKLAGRDDRKSGLAEINANLRDHNTKFKKELDEARAIQQSLLPRELPRDGRFEIAVSYQPLDEVGGDWYFADTRSSGEISLQIADVSGHGLSAAFIGSMAKLAMTAADQDNPGKLLAEMNRLLAPQIPSGRFVTMGSCLYNPASGAIQWARAGHPPALILRRRSSEVVRLLGDGFAVGFFEDSVYSVLEERLERDDILLMFTDGVTEAQNRSGEAFGIDRLSAALKGTALQASGAMMMQAILDTFDSFREGRLIRDDVTILMLKRVV